jgi:MinD superfamily P-loop ATPase
LPKQLAILSGKGGTGKTTVAASFFALAGGAVAADCDVDAPNLHLLLEPTLMDQKPFEGAMSARIDPEKCTRCGLCENACAFGAIKDYAVDHFRCEGCGVCELVCLDEAVALHPERTGNIYASETRFGPLAHALLLPGGEASGKLVTEVKRNASLLAEERGLALMFVDGSPGIGCPVIASISGSDLVLAVAEPTMSGIWGLDRIAGVARHFGVSLAVCINKADINQDIAGEIREYASGDGLAFLGDIPFDEEVNRATMKGDVLTEVSEGPAAVAVRSLWDKTADLLVREPKTTR